MIVIVLAMIITLGIVVGIGGVVVMGMQSRGRGLAPIWGRRFARLAPHLNGDAETPERVQHVVDRYLTRSPARAETVEGPESVAAPSVS